MTGSRLVAVLAAGAARRFGGRKLDAPCAGKPLGQWCLEAVEDAAGPGLIVVPPIVPNFANAAAARGWTLVPNDVAAEGLGSSVAAAARAAERLEATALVLLLADMPLIDTALVARLLAEGEEGDVVATRHAPGRPGVPARFPAALFAVLAALSGDKGAGHLLATLPTVRLLDVDPAWLADVDDPAMLAAAEAMLRDG